MVVLCFVSSFIVGGWGYLVVETANLVVVTVSFLSQGASLLVLR